MTEIGKERGWHKMTRESFDAQRGPRGALLVGNPDVVEKIIRHSKALGGISRITFMMMVNAQQQNNASMQPQGTSQSMAATNATNVNIILVHGLWVDGSSWSKVIPILQNAGHKVIAVQLPLHSLADDIATVKRAIDLIGGPVILVAHSYGGYVITNAGYNDPNVKGLVYVAAHAPRQGQQHGPFPKEFEGKPLLIFDKGGFAYINPAIFHDFFAQDVDQAQAKVLAVVQKPANISGIANEKSGPPAWKQLPTWYQVSENDHVIPPAVEHMFAKQMNATTISLPSSHASPVSHPNEIAQLILNATKGITK
jgi:pimeloyl-ACP methyl ester carboxylesterase